MELSIKNVFSNKFGEQVMLIALSKIAYECGTTIAKSKLIRPVKEVKTGMVADDLRDVNLPQEFLNMQQVAEETSKEDFDIAMSTYNSCLIRMSEVVAREPNNSWFANDFQSIYDRIEGRLFWLTKNSSEREELKAQLSEMKSFCDSKKEVDEITEVEKAKIKERALNSYKEYQSLDNLESLRTLDSDDLDKIIIDYQSETVIPKVKKSIISLCKAFAQKRNFNLDSELTTLGERLNSK